MQTAGIQHHVTIGLALGAHAHMAYQFEHGADVLQLRHIGQRDRVSAEQRGAQLGQSRIFCTGNRHLSVQLAATANQ